MQETLTILGFISGIISLYFLVYKPMNEHSLTTKENTMMSKSNAEKTEENTRALNEFRSEMKEELKEIRNNQKESIERIERNKKESHVKIWKHNEEQDKKIEDHELRIRIIEKEVKDGKED